jgi:hypothetical protein
MRIDDAARKGTVVQDSPARIAARVLPLLGDAVTVLHAPWADAGEGLSGSDVDCAVSRLDPMWPLRLHEGWRLCQSLHYDARGWTWILEHEGRLLHIDTLDDPRGIGRYGFPTRLLTAQEAAGGAGVSAAYLAAKRIRKGDLTEPEWARIGRLADDDPSCFLTTLAATIGRRHARTLYETCLSQSAPGRAAWRRMRWQQRVRRIRTPWRLGGLAILTSRRVLDRFLRPTGLFVLVMGPDGSGKSTLASSLPTMCGDLFRRHHHWHWRPGLLPRPGAVVRHAPVDPSTPHARAPRSRPASWLLVGYYWADWLLGGFLWIWPLRVRAGLLVNERGWWDMLVDPRRYRLQGTTRLARLLGRLVAHPDLALVLEAPPELLLTRKAEVDRTEISRQATAFGISLPSRVRTTRVDVSDPIHDVQGQAREHLLRELECRAVAGLGAGWSKLPGDRDGRLLVPRGTRHAAREAMRIRPPRNLPEAIAWHAARVLGSLGAFRLLPRGAAPPKAVRQAVAAYLPSRGTLAVLGADDRGIHVALIVDDSGRCHGVARVATSDGGTDALDREAQAIRRLGQLLSPPLSAPMVLDHEPGMLLLQAAQWRPRLRVRQMDEEVAAGLGRFFGAGREHANGPAHGNCTPWTLLPTRDGWVLLDWSQASASMPPFYDLVHYILRTRAVRGGSSAWPDILRQLHADPSPVRSAIRAYATAAAIPESDVPALLTDCTEHLSSDPGLLRGGDR